MKLNYFLESDASKCCPPNVLKKGNRVRWSADDTLMFGRIVSVSGSSVTATDEKFGTKEKHSVPRDAIFQVLAEPDTGGHEMVVVWQKNKFSAAKAPLKVTKLDKEPVEEQNIKASVTVEPPLNAADAKALNNFINTLKKERPNSVKPGASFAYRGSTVTFNKPIAEAVTDRHIERGRVNFKDDREVEEICLTRMDVHDLANLIAKVCVLQAYVDVEKEVAKDQDDRASMEPESFEGEEPKEVNVESVAEKAEDIVSDYARLVKERLDELSRGNLKDLVKHYFSDLK